MTEKSVINFPPYRIEFENRINFVNAKVWLNGEEVSGVQEINSNLRPNYLPELKIVLI